VEKVHFVGLYCVIIILECLNLLEVTLLPLVNTAHSESHCALRVWYLDLVVSIEVAVEVCCCFTVFSC
jgi:hypothetical protein